MIQHPLKTLFQFILLVAAILLGSSVVNGSFAEDASGPEPSSSTIEGSEKIVVYYFHGNYRCKTCRKIEALTRDAVESGFSEALRNGAVIIESVNLEEGNNEHFVEDYQLITRSVVISKYKGDVETAWKRLDRVWQLVGNEAEFRSYITGEMNAFLSESS